MTSVLPTGMPDRVSSLTRVVIAVLTFRRPEKLTAGLPPLLEQAAAATERGDGFAVDVLVVDNDADASARTTVERVGAGRVRYAVEATPGIAAARNRALDESASYDLLVFIDDDEQPEPGWLDALLGTWRETGAGAVMGRVVSLFDEPLEPWLQAGRFFSRAIRPTGTPIPVAAAGNLLLDLREVRRAGVRFDATLGLAGGEDTLFSRQLARAGAAMVWCNESVAVDHVPADRISREWVLRRAWSHGNAAARVELILAETPVALLRARSVLLVRGSVRVAGGALRWLYGLVSRSLRHQARGARALFRGAGMASGALGVVFAEYARADDA